MKSHVARIAILGAAPVAQAVTKMLADDCEVVHVEDLKTDHEQAAKDMERFERAMREKSLEDLRLSERYPNKRKGKNRRQWRDR